MRHFLIRSQLVFVSVILLVTLGMTMALVMRFNHRWDFTKEKIYSLSDSTRNLLKELEGSTIEALAFYPHEDAARAELEVFFKECQLLHPRFKYAFYDPDRQPRLAEQYHVKEFYTVIVRTENRQEKILSPSEEGFANALLRLANPRTIPICFVTGHGEAPLSHEGRNGLRFFRELLEGNNNSVHEIILARDKVPAICQVLVVAGPHRELDTEELNLLKDAFKQGKGIFFLLDPMDAGTGKSFQLFMKEFGVVLGQDVIVDKMSRMVGGDFLVPLVSQYLSEHPITAEFRLPTFFPVARSIQPSTDSAEGIEVMPLAMSGSGSWAETNLALLEEGKAAFEVEGDIMGPISLAVAAQQAEGRMVVVGDSDFITNTYLNLSGNRILALNMIQWLAKDDRFIAVRARLPEFKPLFLTPTRQAVMLGATVAGLPLLFVLAGAIRLSARKKSSKSVPERVTI